MRTNDFVLSLKITASATVILLFVFDSAQQSINLHQEVLAQLGILPKETTQRMPLGAAAGNNFTTYTNPQYGFSLLYPHSWINETKEIDPSANLTFLMSFSPPPPKELGESVAVYLAIKNITGNNTSLKQFVDQEISLLKRPPTSATEDTSARTILHSEPTTIAGNTQAHEVVYAEKISGVLSKIMELYVVSGDKGYILSYLSDTDIYDKYLPTVQRMIDSLNVALISGNNKISASNQTEKAINNKSLDIPVIPATKIKFSAYDERGLGIKFLYPSGWEPIIKGTSDNSTIIEILFPNITSSNNGNNFDIGHWHGPATSFIVLSIADAPSYLSDSNATAALNSLTKHNIALANQTLPNFQLIESNTTSFAGNPADRIVYSFEPSTAFQSMNVWTVKGGKVYTISYSQPMEEYPTYLSVVQKMVESFELTR